MNLGYHQSDVIVRKANREAVGWFAGTSEAQAGGQKATIKRYEGQKDVALKQWVRDIKTLRNLHHENLPQLIGYSEASLVAHCTSNQMYSTTVTRSLRIDDHQIDDWKPPVPAIGRATGFGAPAFGGNALAFPQQHGGFGGPHAFPHHGFGAQAPPMPSIVYLVTSPRLDFTAYITDNPMGRPRPRETRSTSWCFSCRSGCPVGYVNFIQLDAEDVES